MGEDKQRGFGAALVLVVAAVIVVAGFIAWNIYSGNKSSFSKPTQTGGQTQTSTASANSSPQTTQPVLADPNAGYVVIREWGVRFKPVDGLKDVVYAVDPNFHSGNLEYVKFSTKALAQFGVSCSEKEKGTSPLGGLMRAKSKQDFDSTIYTNPQPIGGYYYQYVTPQAACGDSKAANDLETQTLNSFFKPSIKTLEAAQ